jgi:DNA-cytosine methyltransferase
MNKKQKNKFNVLSLFAGAGGLEIALCKSGKVGNILSTDSNPTFLNTLEANFSKHFPDIEHHILCLDVKELSVEIIKKKLGDKIDLIIGGPPCDDFTMTGRQLGMRGNKGPLIYEFLRQIRALRPRAFLFENVPSLTNKFRKEFTELLHLFEKLGYYQKWIVLKACNYGSATIRKRVFICGFRGKKDYNTFSFPSPTHGKKDKQQILFKTDQLQPYKTVSDCLADIPDVDDINASIILNHTGTRHKPSTVRIIKSIPQGKSIRKSYRYRLPWTGQSRSLIAGTDNNTKAYVHPLYDREMTVREYARIHGFPDTWEFMGSNANGLKQVANSVPIEMGTAVINSLLDSL